MLGQRLLIRAARSSVFRRTFSEGHGNRGPPNMNAVFAVADMRPIKAVIALLTLSLIYQEVTVFLPYQKHSKAEPEVCLPVHKYFPPADSHH